MESVFKAMVAVAVVIVASFLGSEKSDYAEPGDVDWRRRWLS